MKYKLSFIKSVALLILLVVIYLLFQKTFNFIDAECFLFLNKNLLNNKFSQYFVGMLSHKNESWINVVVMVAINILSILMLNKASKNDSSKVHAIVLYCWLSFQIVLLINILIFQKILHIHRDSPSIVIAGAIKLSEVLHNSNIKDYSNNSFPAGHALVLIYWALFVNFYATRFFKIISVFLCIVLILPRMITGAHWMSDTIFSLVLGWMYFNLSMWFANKYDQIKKRLY